MSALDTRVDRFLDLVREKTGQRAADAPPDYAAHDYLVARANRELVNITPAERERVRIEIRRRTGC
jgi:hypothetical protein